MKCPFCPDDVKDFDKLSECHLVISEFSVGNRETHTHIHGSLDDRRGIISLIEIAIREAKLEDVFVRVSQQEEKKG